MNKAHLFSFLLLMLCTFFWSVNAAVGRMFASEIPPMVMSLVRWIGASLILLAYTYKDIKPALIYLVKHPAQIVALSFLNITMYNTLLYWAAHTTQSVNINLINTLIPPVTILLAFLITGRKINLKGVAGLFSAFIGTLLIITQGDLRNVMTLNFFPGDLIMVVAVFFWGTYSVLLNKFNIRLKMLPLLAVLMITGTMILAIIQLSLPGTWEYQPKSSHWLVFIFLWTCPSILSNLFWYYGVKQLGAGTASFSIYAMPIWGALIGVFLLGESLSTYHFIGALMIVTGFALNIKKKNQAVQPT